MLSTKEFFKKLDEMPLNENLKLEIEILKNSLKDEVTFENISADILIKKLDLKPIKGITDEDGYFKEFVNTIANNDRESQTEIFYLLKDKQVSCLHILDTTETWHWLGGNEISIYIFKKQKQEKIILNKSNITHTIEKNTLFGAKITNPIVDVDFTLVTCLCTPGFDLKKHYKSPSKKEINMLSKIYPEIIKELDPKTLISNKNFIQSICQLFTCCIGVKENEEHTPLINSPQNNR